MDEKNYNILERIIDKLFSGSFSVLIMIAMTYCAVIVCCVWITIKGRLDPKDFLVIVGGLSAVLMAMWKDYLALKREEKISINGDGEKGDVINEKITIGAKPIITRTDSASGPADSSKDGGTATQ